MRLNPFLKKAQEKILVFDGAMGTSLFEYALSAEDYGSPEYEGCPEQLNYTRPNIIQEIHAGFLEAGADVIETNSFGASEITLAEFGLADKSYELSKLAARLAREVADRYSESEPRFVAGSIGPGTKLVSLSNISFDELHDSYLPQIRGLIDGGVDLLLFETCQDPLQIKAAINAAFTVFREIESSPLSDEELMAIYPRAIFYNHDPHHKARTGLSSRLRFPISVQVTVETTGTLLVGTDISAALTTISAYPVDIIGMNCATGPNEMQPHIQLLSEQSPCLLSCLPNAGIPENIGGHAHFPLKAEDLSSALQNFVNKYGVNIVGGCCGSKAEHIAAIAKAVKGLKPSPRTVQHQEHCEARESVASIYSAVPLLMEPKPLIVGERTNANGSKLFKELLAKSDYEGITELAREQVEEGAHILDVCTAFVGRDELQDMHEVISRINTAVNIPIMVDSTEYPVLEDALKCISGKAVINSANLEDGESRLALIASLANRFGAALVVLTIEEQGMAKSLEDKIRVAERLYDLLVNKHGLNPSNLIYDTLTFTLGSGEEDMRDAGINTIEAIREIKRRHPEVKTILGLSNISFGLDPKLRVALNSVFQYEAVKAGLDLSICNAKKIMPLSKIDPRIVKICEDLIYDKREYNSDGECSYDPLMALLASANDLEASTESSKTHYEGLSIEAILSQRIIDGYKSHIERDLDIALSKGYKALDIINKFLMDGMKIVGERFGSGEMQLPFVLQSASTMKAAVSYLEQFMDKTSGSNSRGSIVIATVKGDVHDIGKNLVDIILSNNGFTVYNLGVKQPIEEILKAVEEHKPDLIGMSGLLVKSTLIMKQNLELLNSKGYRIPVILGGAALTRRFVEEDCANVYQGTVFYGFDAFTDLALMEKICAGADLETVKQEFYKSRPRKYASEAPEGTEQKAYETVEEQNIDELLLDYHEQVSSVRSLKASEIPSPPFWGDRIIDPSEIDLDEVWRYLNLDALIIGQWRMGKAKQKPEDYQKLLLDTIYPKLEALKQSAKSQQWIRPRISYGYYPCAIDTNNPNQLNILDTDHKIIDSLKFPRQAASEHLCLSDYFRSELETNVLAFQIVSIGQESADFIQSLYASSNFDEYLYAYGLAVETTEALAEYAHALIRRELGFAAEDDPDYSKLIKTHYHGMRYSFGYPACPRLEDQALVFRLLKPERLSLSLSEEWQIDPEHSSSAIVVHHPDAKYFNVKSN